MNDIGLNTNQIEKIKKVFSRHPEIEKVILYGSRAKGDYKPFSDIDFTIIGVNLDLSQQQVIENELDDLLLPYKMDISVYHKISNPDLINHIKRVGKVFYKKELLSSSTRF